MLSPSLRRPFGTALIALTLSIAACGGDDNGSTGPDPVPDDVTGTYNLTGLRTLENLTGGGNGLPVTFTDGGGSTLTFNSGSLILNDDDTYTLEVAARFNQSDVTLEDVGTYQLSGSTITFTPTEEPSRMVAGTISGTSMTAEADFGGVLFEIDLEK